MPDVSGRREALWRIGAGYQVGVGRGQLVLPGGDAVVPSGLESWGRVEETLAEYELLGLCPDGHIMELLRPELGSEVVPSEALPGCAEGEPVKVAGRVVRRQRPLAKAVFLTLEDEWGLTPVVVWERKWRELRWALSRPLAVVAVRVSRRDGTLSVVAELAWPVDGVPLSGDFGRRDWR